MRPPLISFHFPIPNHKHQNSPSQSLTVGNSCKRPPPVSDRDHFLGLTVSDFPLFLTSCKRPLNAFFDLHVRRVHYGIQRTLVTTWNYRCRTLDILIFIISQKVDVSGPLFGRAPQWFDSCKRPPPVGDHSSLHFWVVGYGRFECKKILSLSIGLFIIY